MFLALAAGVARWPVFLVLGLAPLAALKWARPRPLAEAPKLPLGRRERLAAMLILGAYGVWYLVNALAPETLADGLTYHLGLPYEFVRLGGFPSRITFYGIMPQGMEMLYTMAFAFGRGPAARLVELAFFLATLPLILRLGRRLGMSDLAALVAAVLYFSRAGGGPDRRHLVQRRGRGLLHPGGLLPAAGVARYFGRSLRWPWPVWRRVLLRHQVPGHLQRGCGAGCSCSGGGGRRRPLCFGCRGRAGHGAVDLARHAC